jgi:predicted AlkP superfamily phosphohydrolase/phosphomutase
MPDDAMQPEMSDESLAPVRPAWRREGTVYVLGIDGLSPDIIGSMAERGELPQFRQLAADGCHGPHQTISPTNSSLLWTSIATGCHHRDHGIDGFEYYDLFGRHVSRSFIRRAKKFGLRRLIKLFDRLDWLRSHFFDGRHVQARTIWDIVSESGDRVGVVNWWHTWPADPVNGFVISDRVHYWRAAAKGDIEPGSRQLTFPEEVLEQIRELVIPPSEVPEDWLRRFLNVSDEEFEEFRQAEFRHHDLHGELCFVLSADLTYLRALEYCLDRFEAPKLVAALFRCPDVTQHAASEFMPDARGDSTTEERRKYGNVVPEAYRFADELVRRVRQRMGEEDTLFVVSDHGFRYQEKRGKYGHARGEPPGVFYAVGPEFQSGMPIEEAGIYDLAPTVLRICGFPVDERMPGRALEELLTEEFRSTHPRPDRIESYGPRRRRHDTPEESERVNKEVEDHLRALGYLE